MFTYLADANVDTVLVSSEFSNWKDRYPMNRIANNFFYRFMHVQMPKGIYAYKFIVDNIWINDPLQSLTRDDYYGQKISTLYVPVNLNVYSQSPQYLGDGEYLFFLKDRDYRKVSWISSQNKWDDAMNPMVLENGYWEIKVKMDKKKLFYKYKVDGEEMMDPSNFKYVFWKSRFKVNVIPKSEEDK